MSFSPFPYVNACIKRPKLIKMTCDCPYTYTHIMSLRSPQSLQGCFPVSSIFNSQTSRLYSSLLHPGGQTQHQPLLSPPEADSQSSLC